MGSHSEAVTQRLHGVDWAPPDFSKRASRAALMQEYLRRSALWAVECGVTEDSPFFDAAHLLAGRDVADSTLLENLASDLEEADAGYYGKLMGTAAVNLAAARDAGMALPALPDLYEPLLVMFERGGDFNAEGARMVDVDTIGVHLGDHHYRMSLPALKSLNESDLDDLDRQYLESRRSG